MSGRRTRTGGEPRVYMYADDALEVAEKTNKKLVAMGMQLSAGKSAPRPQQGTVYLELSVSPAKST